MKDILARANSAVLARHAWSNAIVVLDFDGTLAPIVARPDGAALRRTTRKLLIELAQRYPVAVISGRSHADLVRRLEGVPVHFAVGNHGLEPGTDLEHARLAVRRWAPALRSALEGQQGIEIEDKGCSIALHHRRARSASLARERIDRAIAALEPPPRRVTGSHVIEILPSRSPSRGLAIVRLREQFAADAAIYVGDRGSEEDVFGLDDAGRLFSIRVGRTTASRARWCIPSQPAIDRLLRRLVELRPRAESRRGSRADR